MMCSTIIKLNKTGGVNIDVSNHSFTQENSSLDASCSKCGLVLDAELLKELLTKQHPGSNLVNLK